MVSECASEASPVPRTELCPLSDMQRVSANASAAFVIFVDESRNLVGGCVEIRNYAVLYHVLGVGCCVC